MSVERGMSGAEDGDRQQAVPADRAAGSRVSCPVVGLGASAGGLEALEHFLRHVPEHSGLAFVVVQHMDPTRKGLLVELLQRVTSMPVKQVEDRMTVEPDHVYVIPPGADLSVLHGVLHLIEPSQVRGLRLPIDFFFRSLAADQQERSIGVILSGMGSDGTLGMRAIKGKGGATFVQSPESAQSEGMPRSVIDAGLADVIASAEELPDRILAYFRHESIVDRSGEESTLIDQDGLDKVLILLRAHTGQDFSGYRKAVVHRRVERRKSLHQLSSIADYVRYVREFPEELELLGKELLIGVTSFFRDPQVWEQLKGEVIPQLLAVRTERKEIRAWVPCCSTGRSLIPWQWPSRRYWISSSRAETLRSRSSRPTWTRTPSTGLGPVPIPSTSPRTSRKNVCTGSSSTTRASTG